MNANPTSNAKSIATSSGTGMPRSPKSMARVGCAAGVAVAVLLAASGSAHARGKLIDLHGAVLVGGMMGRGTQSNTPDLFHQTQGPGFGAELGMRLLVLDLSIRFLQTVNQDGLQGTMLTALFGPSLEIPVVSGGKDAQGKDRPPKVVVRPGLAAGFAFGTLQTVKPPLTNDQLAGKGLLVVGRFAVERMFGPILGVGGEVQGGYHYLFGATGLVNGNDHSSGWQVAALGTVAFHLGI
ncbi:MAG: hypothetical protein ABUR63_04680 [Verrucomicrobiota bacterium]